MSDEGEKTCPLCAEEMDLTDKQLKPCKCGYEICVWCWHHIMEMAEKDETQGRCPACRTPYNKEKIVGMTSQCERLVSELNVEKKLKPQKGKSKTSEGRKQLGSVRVIQRNLVYVLGLPFHLADEDILQRKEYFGQYGKVLKVSISRTSTGAIQHFPNSTCSVYITFSKEEEAIRCIQLVHGFILDGRPLRACFGTTKYCHAWLRSMPCSNPDCLYLHEIGSQEDSFTKDEIISAYTRNRVQQITGASYSIQQHTGSVLPSPTDVNYSDNNTAFAGKSSSKASANTPNFSNTRFSPPSSSSGRSAALPVAASLGSRQTSLTNTRVSGPAYQKPSYINDGSASFAKAAVSGNQVLSFTGKKGVHDEKPSISQDVNAIESSEPTNSELGMNAGTSVADDLPASSLCHFPASVPPTSATTTDLPLDASGTVHSATSLREPAGKWFINENSGKADNLCSNILSMSIHGDQKSLNGYVEHIENPWIGQASEEVVNKDEIQNSSTLPNFRLGLKPEPSPAGLQRKDDSSLSSSTIQRTPGLDVSINGAPDDSRASIFSKDYSSFSPYSSNADNRVVDGNSYLNASALNFPCRRPENAFNSQELDDAVYSKFSLSKETRSLLRGYEGGAGSCASDIGESGIISNILSIDHDSWNESLVSPRNLAKMFGEEKRQVDSTRAASSRKLQGTTTTQSRFAFAREDDVDGRLTDLGQSRNLYEDVFKQFPLVNNLSSSSSNGSFQLDKFVNQSNFPAIGGVESDIFSGRHSLMTSNKQPASRSQISAPPGFSLPSRLPPPGFPSIGNSEHFFETASGSHMSDGPFSLRNQYQASPPGSNTYVNGDIEFIDPAILAVGKGTFAGSNNSPGVDVRSGFPSQFGFEDQRMMMQSLLPTSVPQYENLRFSDTRNSVPVPGGDAYYGNSPGGVVVLKQKSSSNDISPFAHFARNNGVPPSSSSNGLWDEARGAVRRSLDAPELLLRNDFFAAARDDSSKFRTPTSDGSYNGTPYWL